MGSALSQPFALSIHPTKTCSFPWLSHSFCLLLLDSTLMCRISTYVNFRAGCFPFTSSFFDTLRKFYIPSLTHSPIFSALTTIPMFLKPPISQPTSGQICTTPILTLDTFDPQRKVAGTKKATSFWEHTYIYIHFPARSGKPGTGLGDMVFAYVSFSLAGGSKTRSYILTIGIWQGSPLSSLS